MRGNAAAVPLAHPPGRQGPGPMPGALVEALDLVLARRAAGALPGERRAAGRGTGTMSRTSSAASRCGGPGASRS